MTVRRALGLLAVAIAAAAVLNAAGTALPAPPLAEPDRLAGWWARQGTAAATLSVARLGAMALCFYLILISLLGAVAGITRWRWSEALAAWIATPALRRMIAGGSLAAVMTSTQAAAAAPAVYSVVDFGEAQAESLHHPATGLAAAHARRAGHSITDLGAAAARGSHHSVTDLGAAPVRQDALSVTDLGVAWGEPVDSPAAHVSDHATDAADPDGAARADSTGTATSNPASTNNDPHPTTSNPASADSGTGTATSNPASTNNDPHPATSNPASADSGTDTATSNPASADSGTDTATSNPADTHNDPDPAADDPDPAADDPARADDSPRSGGFDTWIVEPGDHLWGIAAATVAERSGSDDPTEVASYWLKLIEANADTVGDSPDLIHPGQLIRLPG